MLIRYILYTGIVLISICNGELLLLSKPDNDKTVYSCLASGDDENSTLFWWSNNKPLNLLPSNPFEEEEIKIPSNNWSNGLSFSFNVEPLTDERWEDLPIIKIGRNKSHEISHSSIMRLSLSFYAEDEVQLLFNNNNRIIFRNQELPTENIFLIQYGKWNHISLTKTQFYLNSNQKNVSFNIDLSYVTIRPINEDSYWKIHNYTFIFSKRAEKATPVAHIHHNGEPLCLSFFITMCYNCSLTLKVNNENRLIQNRNRDNQWQKHNIYFPKTRSSILVLYTSSNNSQGEYWIIHKFTKCRKETQFRETERLRSSIVITKESNVTCTNSEEPKELISRNTCFEEDYYSNFCKLKLKSEYKDPCKQSKICIENKGCVCSWGFKGKKCTEECERGKWGINCNNTCGNCAKPETCDKFTGKCDECAGNYFGNYCYGLPKIHLSDISFTSSVINLQNGIYQARQLHYKLISENTWTTIQIYNKSYINIINLQAGQTYQLKLFYNISSTCEYELDFAETNFTTKFEVERLENFTISTTSHSAKFSWTPKDKCESLKNGYKIKYRLLHKIFCNVSNRTPEFSTVANETNFEINDLQSFSTYHILIYITTDGGKTLGDIIHNGTFNTTDGDISSEELPTAITATNTSIVIKQAKCESLNGNITYELIFKTSNITLDVQQNTPVPYEKELNVTIQGLLPFSKYSVILKIVRNNSTREYKQSQIVFTSLPGEPPMVREAVVYSKNISHIWLRWKPPNPPNGELEHYNITILQLKNTTVKNTFQRKRHPCKFWTGYECYIIESFNNSASYAIKIEAKNKNVDKFGEAVFVNITSKQGKCHSPTNISTEIKNNNILTVKWLCAPITNGTFQRFYINFSPVHNDNVKEKIIDATDPAKHKCEVSEQLNFSSTYKISINGVNECIGFSYYILVDTFPPEPSFNASVEESCSNISCIVRIQSLKNISETSTLYVTTSSSQRNNCDIYDINKFIEENKNESCKTSLNQTTTDLNIDFQNCADRICGSHINTINCSDQFLTVIVVNYYYHRFNNSTICLNITYNNGNINQNKLSIIIAGATIGAVFFLIVLVIIIYIIFFRNKGKDDIFNVAFSKRNGCQIGRPEEVALCSKNNEIYESTSNLLSMSVQIDEYENYLRNYFGNNKEELRKQFEVIPKMELHSSSVGTLESNKNKNRYKNIKAYEHSRVKLKGLPSDNASYYY